jgi:hypothetical protein
MRCLPLKKGKLTNRTSFPILAIVHSHLVKSPAIFSYKASLSIATYHLTRCGAIATHQHAATAIALV